HVGRARIDQRPEVFAKGLGAARKPVQLALRRKNGRVLELHGITVPGVARDVPGRGESYLAPSTWNRFEIIRRDVYACAVSSGLMAIGSMAVTPVSSAGPRVRKSSRFPLVRSTRSTRAGTSPTEKTRADRPSRLHRIARSASRVPGTGIPAPPPTG